MMLKRLLLVITSLLLLASITGSASCSTPTVTAKDGSVIKDFYLIYESGISVEGLQIKLDTKDNRIGLWGYEYKSGDGARLHRYYFIKYHMPQKRLQELYNDIIKYDIKSYSSPDVLGDRYDDYFHESYSRITFRINGEIYTVTVYSMLFDDPERWYLHVNVYNLWAFTNLLYSKYYEDTKEYQTFPGKAEGNY